MTAGWRATRIRRSTKRGWRAMSSSSAITNAPRPQHELALSASHRKASEAVASGVRQAKTDNTRRAHDQAWGGITPGPRPGTPIPPGDATNRGPLPRPSTSATWQRPSGPWPPSSRPAPRFPTSTLLPSSGRRRGRQGWRNRARAPSQADVLTADVLNRVREVLRLPRRGRGAGQPQLAVMPRPRQAGASLCGRRVGVCNRRSISFPPFPLCPGLSGQHLPHPMAGAERTFITEKNN